MWQVLRDARWIGGLTKVVISCVHQFIPKGCSLCCSDTGSKGYKVKTTQLTCKQLNQHQLRVPKITLGTCSWTNKEHFPLKMYSHSLRGTEVTATEDQWLLSKWLKSTTAKNPDNSLELMCTPHYILPNLYISIMAVTSLNDVMIICFPLPVGKTLCMCSRVMPTHLHICWHPHWPILTVLLLHMNWLINSVSQFPSLWHSPPGISVHPHARAWNLLNWNNMLKWFMYKYMAGNISNMTWNEHDWQLYTLNKNIITSNHARLVRAENIGCVHNLQPNNMVRGIIRGYMLKHEMVCKMKTWLKWLKIVN